MASALQSIIRPLALLAAAFFLLTSFRTGWTTGGTDFPNYYTAAVLLGKGAPLRNYYNWTWFQKQMDCLSLDSQLGGYIPQTPLTMLPILPMASLTRQTAKRVWLLLNVAFLGGTFLLLSRVTRFSVAQIALLCLAGYGTLKSNFLLGQYYVFLLFLLTLSFYFLATKRNYSSGLLMGAAFALKLYGGPFALYFVVKRHWKPFAGMLIGIATATLAAFIFFGWKDLTYFALQILPRAIAGETLDPYNSGNGTITTLLRRTFMMERELNPHPLWNAPWAFFFSQPLITVLILILPLVLTRSSGNQRRDFAWFFIALILASPNTASYTFVLLLLPVVLLLHDASPLEGTALIASYIALGWAGHPAWNWLFPRVWLLLFLFVLAGRQNISSLRRVKPILITAMLAIVIAAGVSYVKFSAYLQEPGRRWEQIAVEPGAIYSSWPVLLQSGMIYESIGKSHYVLRWLHGHKDEELTYEGDAFHPTTVSPIGPVQFDLVRNCSSKTLSLDALTGKVLSIAGRRTGDSNVSTVSPDGKWLAFTAPFDNTEQIWLKSTTGGAARVVTGGNCNSFSPTWGPDSRSVVFASDCDRGIGLPALYRAQLSDFLNEQ